MWREMAKASKRKAKPDTSRRQDDESVLPIFQRDSVDNDSKSTKKEKEKNNFATRKMVWFGIKAANCATVEMCRLLFFLIF
jgi:hypothetical protein